LHPVASGLAFIAGLCAIGGWLGSLIGTIIAILAWIITLVVMVIDFVVFGVSIPPKLLNAVDRITNDMMFQGHKEPRQ
jgi:hypothetical protein